MNQYLGWMEGLIKGNSPMIFLVVFIVGFVSSLNPHMISMVMMFMGYFVDKELENKRTTLIKSIIFSLCFVITLGILAMVINIIGSSLHGLMKISYLISSVILLVLGFKLLGIRPIKIKNPIKVVYMHVSNKHSIFSPMYLVFSLLSTHCSIPFVISILTLASLKNSLLYSVLLVALFGFGHSLIFILGGVSSTLLSRMRNRGSFGRLIIKGYAVFLMVIAFYLIISVI